MAASRLQDSRLPGRFGTAHLCSKLERQQRMRLVTGSEGLLRLSEFLLADAIRPCLCGTGEVHEMEVDVMSSPVGLL